MCRPLKRARSCATICVLVFSLAAPLYAHHLHIDVYVEAGATIRGEAYYHDSKAAGAKVEVFAPDGKKLGELKTDENGEFVFEAKFKCDHKFTVTDSGHQASASVPAEDLPDNLPDYGK